MTHPQAVGNIFIIVSMWSNDSQSYYPVGSLLYDNTPSHRKGLSGFVYTNEYLVADGPAIDPAHLDPKINSGRFTTNKQNGRLPCYFSEFIPSEFGQKILNNKDRQWNDLSEVEKLHAVTLHHGDFGAIQLNAQNDQHNAPLHELSALSNLVEKIRSFQNNIPSVTLSKDLQNALCTFSGAKPKINYKEEVDGIAQRFIVKVNTSGMYNDARVAATFSALEKNAGITTCENRVETLECGEDILMSCNYTRHEKFDLENKNDSRLLYKYNRISFKTLLSGDSILGNTERPSYRHIAYAIDKYSADPVSDREELFRRAVFSACTNHTSNGLDNMEMFHLNGGWRLSPSYNNLPNPITSTQFNVGFDDSIMTGDLLTIDHAFITALGTSLGLNASRSLEIANVIAEALTGLDNAMESHALSVDDQNTIKTCIKSDILLSTQEITMTNNGFQPR